MTGPTSESDEISLVEVAIFLRRESRKLSVVFLICFGATIGIILTRPLLFQAKMDFLIGSSAAFSSAPVEPLDQLKYIIESRYNDDLALLKAKPITITNIRNTNILNVTAIHEQKAEAIKLLDEIAQSLIEDHAKKIEQKKAEAQKLLVSSSNLHERDITNYVEILSSANRTRLVSEIKLRELPYSGMLTKGLVIGLFGSILISLLGVFALKIYRDVAEALRRKS